MAEIMGPVGFQNIENAPRDGTFVRLRFRPHALRPEDYEIEGRWMPNAEMPAGGWWFDRHGHYVSPGPLFWASINRRLQ